MERERVTVPLRSGERRLLHVSPPCVTLSRAAPDTCTTLRIRPHPGRTDIHSHSRSRNTAQPDGTTPRAWFQEGVVASERANERVSGHTRSLISQGGRKVHAPSERAVERGKFQNEVNKTIHHQGGEGEVRGT